MLPHGKLPELKYVVGSNNCMIGFEVSPRTGKIIVVSCTDNLIKGCGRPGGAEFQPDERLRRNVGPSPHRMVPVMEAN